MAAILLINGPNLNLLGQREPHLYGADTLQSIEQALTKAAQKAGHSLSTFQSNAEHALIERIQQATPDGFEYIIINPAALTHTSVALRDALLASKVPFIEVHISNIFARESFRQTSYLSDIASGVISGLGTKGYQLALDAIIDRINKET